MIDKYIKTYGKRLYGFCLTLCADTFEADDLYQETWLKALKHFLQYDNTKDFEPWITKICVNTYRNALKSKARSRLVEFQDNEEKEAFMQSIPTTAKEDNLPLYEAIERLPQKLRLAVILFYFRDMDIASTAKVLDIPAGTVKSRLNKARKRLKEVLTDETDIRF